jgi:hypothetical protein
VDERRDAEDVDDDDYAQQFTVMDEYTDKISVYVLVVEKDRSHSSQITNSVSFQHHRIRDS